MDTDDPLSAVHLVLRHGFLEHMDQLTAELERLGWIAESTGNDDWFDNTWQHPQSRHRSRVRTRFADCEFAIVLSVTTQEEVTAVELADLTRSVIEQWPTLTAVTHSRDNTSDLWIEEHRWIELHLFRRVPAGAHKEIPPGVQLTVSNPER